MDSHYKKEINLGQITGMKKFILREKLEEFIGLIKSG